MPFVFVGGGEESVGEFVREEIGTGTWQIINRAGCASECGARKEGAHKGGGG